MHDDCYIDRHNLRNSGAQSLQNGIFSYCCSDHGEDLWFKEVPADVVP